MIKLENLDIYFVRKLNYSPSSSVCLFILIGNKRGASLLRGSLFIVYNFKSKLIQSHVVS